MPLDPSIFDLTGRVALVTGAAQGIGEAIAMAFARFGAGLALCDRNGADLARLAAEIEVVDVPVCHQELDVRDPDALDTFFDHVSGFHDRLDIVVNNAGGGFRADFVDLSPNAEDALIKENFTSVAGVTRRAVPLMADGGSIINITSIEAHRAAPGYAVYSAMKAGVANLTKTLALELGGRGIRVNCIAPDVIPTPGIGGLHAVKTPLPYAGHVDDVAAAAVYLAGDGARFVTGSTLSVDGGNRAAGGWHRDAHGAFTP